MENANNRTIEDVINTIDVQYRISAYLKLRGHISFKVTKLTGMFLAKKAKEHMVSKGLEGADAFREAMSIVAEGGIDAYNDMLNGQREREVSDEGIEEMGLNGTDEMFNTIKAMVGYANKLNFDLQELFDPSGRKAEDPHYKQRGVYFNEADKLASWTSSVALVASSEDKPEMTYAEYVKSVQDEDWTLSEEEFNEQTQKDNSLFDDYRNEIVELLMAVGDHEVFFEELPLRTQIAAIENMRGKIDSCITSALKSVKYSRSDNKLLEASTVKGLIKGWDKLFCEMLDTPKFSHLAEFMYNYTPSGAIKPSKGITRRIVLKDEQKLHERIKNMKLSDTGLKAHESKLKVDLTPEQLAEHMANIATMENDEL